MSELTARQRLIERVAARFQADGVGKTSYPEAVQAVDAFYAENLDCPHYALVAHEAVAIMVEVMPPFVTHMRAAFEAVGSAMAHVTESARTIGPYAEMAMRLKRAENPRFNASGLPTTDGPYATAPVEHHVDPPVSANIDHGDVPDEVSLEDTGRRLRAHADGTMQWGPGNMGSVSVYEADDLGREVQRDADGNLSHCPHPADQVIELTEREWHLACARRLRQLDCTYGELQQMATAGDFATSQHHMAWFSFGGNVRLEQLDRANFVLDILTRGDAFGIDMDDAAIARVEERYPTDRITGAPHHYILNGDHSACGCGGDHVLDCTIWDKPHWRHKASICGISRTLCNHSPKHHYGQPCDDYHENMVDDATTGEPTA